jgi:hypothetical protein
MFLCTATTSELYKTEGVAVCDRRVCFVSWFPGRYLLNRTFSMKSFVDAAGGLLEMSKKF